VDDVTAELYSNTDSLEQNKDDSSKLDASRTAVYNIMTKYPDIIHNHSDTGYDLLVSATSS
jgi:hypothetical protein